MQYFKANQSNNLIATWDERAVNAYPFYDMYLQNIATLTTYNFNESVLNYQNDQSLYRNRFNKWAITLGNVPGGHYEYKAYQVNPAATNLVPNGTSFSSQTGVTTANNSNTPIAGISGTLITKSLAGSGYYANQVCSANALLPNTNYVLSRFFKWNGTDFTTSIEFNNGGQWGNTSFRQPINIRSSGVTLGTSIQCTAVAETWPNGWYRVAVKILTGATISGGTPITYLMAMDNAVASGSSFLTGCPQLETGLYYTDYINTTGTAASRAREFLALVENGQAIVESTEAAVFEYTGNTNYIQ